MHCFIKLKLFVEFCTRDEFDDMFDVNLVINAKDCHHNKNSFYKMITVNI